MPHYAAMYAALAAGGAARRALPGGLERDEVLRRTVGKAFRGTEWVYDYDVSGQAFCSGWGGEG